ncbi:MAG TPA: multiheme c-type cytochrome [Bacteroidota bacterium]|jgi:nitrate/TMAO reductase-like tetraheme cytochrome c subunit
MYLHQFNRRRGCWELQWVFLISGFLLGAVGTYAQEEARKDFNRLFEEKNYPSAITCKTCHPDHYREWSVSAHAYAQLSPVFNAMSATIVKETNGTNGDFCVRCHTQIGMNREEEGFMSNMDRHPASREGITCIVCHRLEKPFGKASGRLAIVKGDLFDAMYGPTGNKELKRVIASGEYNVNTNRAIDSRNIHTDVIVLEQISTSGFCGTCHDVNLVNGFRLEEAFSDYKSSPASGDGVSCQDCHMGLIPGKNSGYAQAPAAKIGGKESKPRKRTNHMFAGPDYSVIHPGLFPHNSDAAQLATMREWLTFKHEEGWGTTEWEKRKQKDYKFPPRWVKIEDRIDARKALDANQRLLEDIKKQRLQILQAGYQLGDVEVDESGPRGISFSVQFKNGTDGHSIPTGFDAERVVFLRVTVTDSKGTVVFRSGDFDPNGDLRDLHSLYVHNGDVPRDEFLFSLQTKIVVRMNRGGEREQILAVNYSPSASPFLRPSTSSTVLLGRPTAARKHRKVIPPLADDWPNYQVDEDALAGTSPPYKVNLKIIAGMVPVNLVSEIKDVGFDYNMSPQDIAKGILAGYLTVQERDVELQPGRISALPGPESTSFTRRNQP